jgi:lysophospholipase L1-like esterase
MGDVSMTSDQQKESPADPTAGRAYQVRPFGDSITMGWQGGYRADLLRNLPNKLPFHFVGGSTEQSTWWMLQYGQGYHDGYSGYRIDQLWAIAQQPRYSDIILVHAGTNDILQGTDARTTAQRLHYLIQLLLQQNHFSKIIVAKILPIFNHGKENVVEEYNRLVSEVAGQYNNFGIYVDVVDMFTGITPADLSPFDGVHPVASGYWKMADRWRLAINMTPALKKMAVPDADAPPEQFLQTSST